MSVDGRDPKKPDPADYETAVLDFLDRELAAASPRAKAPKTDEVDDLVSNLLKQAITASDQQEASPETKPDELDALLAGILRSSAGEAAPKPPVPAPVVPSPPPLQTPAATTSPAAPRAQAAPQETPRGAAQSTRPVKPAGQRTLPQARSPKGVPRLVWLSAGILPAAAVAAYFLIGSQPTAPPKPEARVEAAQLSLPPVEPAPDAATTEPAAPPELSVAAPAQPASRERAADAGARSAAKPITGAAGEAEPQTFPAPRSAAEQTHTPPSSNATDTPEARQSPPRTEPAAAPAANTAPPVTAAEPLEPSITVVAQMPSAPSRPATSELAFPGGKSEAPDLSAVRPRMAGSRSLQDVAQPIRQAPVSPAVLTQKVNPVYPVLALRARVSGTVVVDIDIDDRGNVSRATPVSGPALLHAAALNAVMQWRYRPASQGGSRIPSRSRVEIKFENRER